MQAAVVTSHGGHDKIVVQQMPTPQPGAGEALVRVMAAGVNFIDIYFRTGAYPSKPPYIPGVEGAGLVQELGEGTEGDEWLGKRVTWVHVGSSGTYAEYTVVPVAKLVPLDPQITYVQAASAIEQGMTAHYLIKDTVPGLSPGDTVLVHSAAGGTGRMLLQIAKMQGLRTLGLVSSEAKKAVAVAAGADEVLVGKDVDFAGWSMKLTKGEGVAAVFDGVGNSTFLQSFDCLRRRGTMVLFGASSGKPEPFNPARLQKGSLFLTRPTLFDYIATTSELQARASDVLGWVKENKLSLETHTFVKLSDAAEVQRRLESRETTGKQVLVPFSDKSEL
eukprot:gnl/MRDRNA2_/MRDRNA2_49738_c0_seq1.p1 gnl/MRDRNA2_/MRDRNA2_49738_c0~~gnl/MRDRNA2_/MRDRNA2_49738_c0_seq1.p1  ORF type:complete len:389 (-),score=55.81 gnl/MRDRNA2_/MRDRNA2_49738_c0_seq1:20-1018(-)